MKFFTFALFFFVFVFGVSANYLTGTKGGSLPTKGGLSPATQTKGSSTLPTKGGPLKGLLKPSPKPVHSLNNYPLRPQSKVEQKIEQKVEQQVVQQEEEPLVQQQQESAKRPMKVGITKWEQNVEEPKKSYKPRKSILKPQVQKIEQQVIQQQVVQQEEEPVQQQVLEQLPLGQKVLKTPLLVQKPLPTRNIAPKLKPVRTEQKLYQNVRQVPTTFNADAGWE